MKMIEYPKKVLLATDGVEGSSRAAEVAVALAGQAGD
jgi:nucleotide-binding universal stress UspA family protein